MNLPSVESVLTPLHRAINEGGKIDFTELLTQDRHTQNTMIVEMLESLDTNHFCDCKKQCFHTHTALQDAIDKIDEFYSVSDKV